MIKSYKHFKLDLEIDSSMNESMVYFSPRFREQIKKIDSPITQKILDLEGVDIKDDISFIDFDETPGMFTFKTMKNFKKGFEELVQLAKDYNSPLLSTYLKIGNEFEPTKNFIDKLWKEDPLTIDGHNAIMKSRNPLKIGRFINSIFPNQFSAKEIEEFTNKYKALQGDLAEKFIIVEGDEIAKWYNSQNYAEMKHTLGTSCMRYADKSYFQIYTKNPEVCKMLCLIKEDKLLGRALLWKPISTKKVRQDYTIPHTEASFEWFMDRQYAISDSLIQKFKDYAIKEGWAYKTSNTHSDLLSVTFRGEIFNCNMEVKLKNIDYTKFPFTDTFRKYDPEFHILYNNNDSSEEGYYLLNSTGGGYETTGQSEDDDNEVYSEYYGEYIDRDYAVWSDTYDSYLHIDSSVEVTSGSRRNYDWYPDSSNDIRWDGWIEEYIHEDDSVYSEEYGYYLLDSEAVSVVNRIESNGDCNEDMYFIHNKDFGVTSVFTAIKYSELTGLLWFNTLTKHFQNYQVHEGISKSCLFKDENDKWMPVDFSETIHEVKPGIWLSTIDMDILDLENWTKYKGIDKISYSQSLIDNNYVDRLILRIEEKLKVKKEGWLEDRLKQLKMIKAGDFPDYSL